MPEPITIALLAGWAVKTLAPYLPKLLDKAAEKLGEKAGEEGWEKAKALGGLLLPSGGSDIITLGLAEEVAKAPDDADALAAFELRIKKLLKDNAELAAQVEQLQKSSATGGVSVHVEKGTGVGVVQGDFHLEQTIN